MRKAHAEKIGVVIMFVLVLVVFSFAERDTQKMIRQQIKTAEGDEIQTTPTVSETATKMTREILTRN